MTSALDAEIAALEARLKTALVGHVPWSEDHAPIPTPRLAGLSKAQKALLERLYRETQATHTAYHAEVTRYGNPIWTRDPAQFGVPWSTDSDTAENTRSHAAAQSRALHRLADRGLVVRLNHYSGGQSTQATYVRLTKAGLDLAQRLTCTHVVV